MATFLRIQGMRNLSDHNSALIFRLMVLFIAMLGSSLLWSASAPIASAKGPVKFKLCGELGCVTKKSPRFTAAMLYGGRLHVGPGCSTRVHRVVASIPGSNRDRRYLMVASRGLIGEQGGGGYVWWRKVGGIKRSDLVKGVKPAGRGFAAGPEFYTSTPGLGGGPDVARWRLRSGRVSCDPFGWR